MKAFYGDPAIKQMYLDRIAAHRAADNLIWGTGWDSSIGKGCAIGCTFEEYNHSKMESEWDVPVMLAKLEDQFFENLPEDNAMEWPQRFCEAIPVGADLSLVGWEFLHWLIADHIQPHVTKDTKPAIDLVIAVLAEKAVGRVVSDEAVLRARRAAYAAADAYAYAHADSAAAAVDSADSDSDAADSAVDSAADAYAYAYDDADARQKSYITQSEKLLELMRGAS